MSTNAGVDFGMSSKKFVTSETQGEIPSWLSRGKISTVVGSGTGNGNIRFKGQDYIVGKDAVLGAGFSWSGTEDKDDHRNLIFCLYIFGRLGITDANLIAGLPVSQASSPAVVNRFKSLLSGRHEIIIGEREMNIDLNVSVLAEPLGSYFSLVLSPEGRLIGSSPYLASTLGIIDIGHRTVDVVALDNGRLATTQDSTLSGIVILYEKVYKLLEMEYGKLRPNEIAKIHNFLIGGCQDQLTIAGRPVRTDLPVEVSRLKAELAEQIMDEVSSLLSAIRPDKLIVTGGGAKFLGRELMRINPHLLIHPQPRMANAIGFYRAAIGRNG